jgi:hypothetical protein
VRAEREPAILVDRYALQVLLDRTSIGMVWLATDRVLDRSVTVTLVDPRIADDPDARGRLFDNARALAAVTPRRLARLLDAGTDGETPFLVTERVPGETLADLLERDGPMPAVRAAGIVADALEGVREARDAGVPSPDIGPSAVVLDRDGRVRIRETGVVCATVAEAGSRMPDDDVRAAGALLFELLTGRALEHGAEADGLDIRVDAPRPVRTILARSIGEERDRFGDTASMASALRASAGADGTSAAPTRAAVPVFRTWIAVPLVVVIVAGVVLGTGIWLGRLELGGPVGIRIPDSPSAGAPAADAEVLPVASVTVVDPPPGDGTENDDTLGAVTDGDPATVWRSENYFDGTLNKPGVGVVLDLGDERTVTGFRLSAPPPAGFSFSILVGDDPASMVEDAAAATSYTAPDAERDLAPRTGRYVVVWITSVVPLADGSNRAEIADVRLLGTA